MILDRKISHVCFSGYTRLDKRRKTYNQRIQNYLTFKRNFTSVLIQLLFVGIGLPTLIASFVGNWHTSLNFGPTYWFSNVEAEARVSFFLLYFLILYSLLFYPFFFSLPCRLSTKIMTEDRVVSAMLGTRESPKSRWPSLLHALLKCFSSHV